MSGSQRPRPLGAGAWDRSSGTCGRKRDIGTCMLCAFKQSWEAFVKHKEAVGTRSFSYTPTHAAHMCITRFAGRRHVFPPAMPVVATPHFSRDCRQFFNGIFSPKGAGSNDSTPLERVVNICTSLPMLAVGWHTSQRRSGHGRVFGASFVAVSFIAMGYHAASGAFRCIMRKCDYWSIAWASFPLRRATGLQFPQHVAPLFAAVVPVKPTLITGINITCMELHYAWSAFSNASLLGPWLVHAVVSTAAISCFASESWAMKRGFPFLHSLWHVGAALSMGSTNALMQHNERNLLQRCFESNQCMDGCKLFFIL